MMAIEKQGTLQQKMEKMVQMSKTLDSGKYLNEKFFPADCKVPTFEPKTMLQIQIESSLKNNTLNVLPQELTS